METLCNSEKEFLDVNQLLTIYCFRCCLKS
jgi:hypothetical protein